jgi:uncharacterized protein YwqG
MTIQHLTDRIAPFKKTAWLPVVKRKTGSVFNSKFSGIPLLDENEAWPCCGHCQQPIQLFVQLNADDLPVEAGKVFGDGILQVFYCTNAEKNCECECEAYAPFAKSTLLRIIEPAKITAKLLTVSLVLDAFPEKVIVDWQAADDYPNYEELDDLGVEISDDDAETLYEQDYCPKEGDKLLGWAAWVQGVEYPDCPDCGERMKYIFQIDSDDNLDYMFGDVGCAHISQCELHPEQLAMAWACC